MSTENIPLCVDLDGTLLRTDTLYESVLILAKHRPQALLSLPLWLLRGKAFLKQKIAEQISLDPATLPYNNELLAWLRDQHRCGRELALVTAADQRVAKSIAAHQGIFSRVLASDGSTNLSGARKRAKLDAVFGPRRYDYAGNALVDLQVWSSAREAIVVSGNRKLIQRVSAVAAVTKVFPAAMPSLADWIRAVRVHQWAKNVLVFLPLLLSHQVSDLSLLSAALLAFAAFCCCASSIYIVNDLLDLEADRLHPSKRRRPFASGQLHLGAGILVSALLLALAFGLAWQVSLPFVAVLGFYCVLTLSYSAYLKRIVLLDLMLLAAGYILRLVAGGVATGVDISFWLLAFALFTFFSLAIVKRFTELDLAKANGIDQPAGRGYVMDDMPLLRTLGIASGFSAILVLALYINTPQSRALYEHSERLWALCPLLLYWMSRTWLLVHRGEVHDDPVVFALRDGASQVVAALAVVIFLLAT